jgi:hypothetical protein
MILIVFLALLAIFILSNLSLFKSYKNVLDSPKAANSEIVYPADRLPVVTATFSLSIWVYIQDWNAEFGNSKNIIYYVRDGGGPTTLALDSYENNLIIKYDVKANNGTQTKTNTITIPNINIQKWVNMTVCFGDQNVDTYINGKLIKTSVTPNTQLYIINQTNGFQNPTFDITPDGGFTGSISQCRYYNRFLTPQEAWDIYKSGVNSNFLNQYSAKFTFYNQQNGQDFWLF